MSFSLCENKSPQMVCVSSLPLHRPTAPPTDRPRGKGRPKKHFSAFPSICADAKWTFFVFPRVVSIFPPRDERAKSSGKTCKVEDTFEKTQLWVPTFLSSNQKTLFGQKNEDFFLLNWSSFPSFFFCRFLPSSSAPDSPFLMQIFHRDLSSERAGREEKV